jgi:predicted RNase H-like HicB family nuclease
MGRWHVSRGERGTGETAADGSSRQEALANAETVIAEWLETARDLGRGIPEPKGRLLFA